MNESQAQKIQSNIADVPSDPTASKGPGIKPVDIDAPYEHALPVDSDPWTTLLTPELEADTLRCSAWKDEVQNLLIFAGLFSAVVTAFVIESYKFLLPDPNDAITGLLFHIASGLNNTSPFPPSVSPDSILTPFLRTSSTVRINAFWFISLILSLTTVLVGTIALQWLREHQSYSGYSSKEKLAMLYMRSQAMEAWYLPQVFAALPLLLQAALILFLAGLIDFSLPLGPEISIPVSIIIGLTLLFLAATTILPSLQGLSFFCGLYLRKTVPTPCPFKSPQSHALRTLFGLVLRAIFRVFPPPDLNYDSSSLDINDWKWVLTNRSLLIPDHLAPFVYNLWYQSTWPTLDREWLSLRDAYHQRIFDDDPELYQHQTMWKSSFPLSDITQYLGEATYKSPGFKHTGSFLVALVHCFNELAESIWTAPDLAGPQQRKDRRSNYFEKLYPGDSEESCSLSKFLLHGGIYKFDQLSNEDLVTYFKRSEIKPWFFRAEQTINFLYVFLANHPSSVLFWYRQELWVRVLHSIGNIAPLTPIITDGSKPILILTSIRWPVIYSMTDNALPPDQRFSATTTILTTIFDLAISRHVSQDRTIEPLLANPQVAQALDSLALRIDDYLTWARVDTLTKQDVLRDIDDRLTQLFKLISNYLNEKQSTTSSNSQNASLDFVFYLSSIFSWHLLYWREARNILGNPDSHFGQAFRSLLDALYKTWSSGQKNDLLEKRFEDDDEGVQRFSNKWWNQIFKYVTAHRVIEQGPSFTEEQSLGSHPDASSQAAIPSENKPEDIIPLTAISPRNLYHPPISNTHDSDNPLPSAHPDPPPEISGCEPASSMVNRAGDSIPHSPSGLPTILHHPGTSTEGTGTNNDPLLSHSRPSSEGLDETRPLADDGTTAGAALRSISEPLTSINASDPEGVVPQQATGNGASRTDEQDLRPDRLHLAIDVGPPMNLQGIGTEIPGSGGDHLLDKVQREDMVIRIEPPI